MALDIQKLFNEKLPSSFKKNAQDARAINSKFQLNIDGVGEWFVNATHSGPSITKGNPGGADCEIWLSSEDFQKLFENPQANGMQLYLTNRIRVEGNPMLAMRLVKLFALASEP
jgi:putative sterol carrier protein